MIVDGVEVALFRDGEVVHALANHCPHRGGPIADGMLVAGLVECPWHGWRFDPATGASPLSPSMQVDTHPARVEDGWVVVTLPDPDGPTTGAPEGPSAPS